MQFNSVGFLFTFLPVFLAVYYFTPQKFRNISLLLGSVVFYGMIVQWAPLPILLLACLTVLTWGLGRLMGRNAVFFWAGIVFFALTLVFFKCYDGGKHLPAGMSFYLFQMAAYLVAVYQRKLEADRNILHHATGVWMFPKVLSGPLMEPYALQKQTVSRRVNMEGFHKGLQLFIVGLSLKVILANRIGGLWSQAGVVGYENISPIFAWMGLTAFVMKLYFDFFGYSVMAMGLGRMLGFWLPRNFDDPYTAKSVSEFYRRWHVSLGAWFRENIYIPMGGNRKGTGRTIFNLLVVWTLTGLWHGVGGNYLLWAGILVVFIIMERLWLGKYLNKSKVLCHFYMVFVIFLSWVPFAIGDWQDLLHFFGRLFGITGKAVDPLDYLIWLEKYGLMLGTGAFLMTSLPRKIWKKIENHWTADVICFVLFWICVYFIATAAQDPFMYGQY